MISAWNVNFCPSVAVVIVVTRMVADPCGRDGAADQVLSIRGTLASNIRTKLTIECKSFSSSNLQLLLGSMQEPEAVKIGTSLTKWHAGGFGDG